MGQFPWDGSDFVHSPCAKLCMEVPAEAALRPFERGAPSSTAAASNKLRSRLGQIPKTSPIPRSMSCAATRCRSSTPARPEQSSPCRPHTKRNNQPVRRAPTSCAPPPTPRRHTGKGRPCRWRFPSHAPRTTTRDVLMPALHPLWNYVAESSGLPRQAPLLDARPRKNMMPHRTIAMDEA